MFKRLPVTHQAGFIDRFRSLGGLLWNPQSVSATRGVRRRFQTRRAAGERQMSSYQ